MGKGKGRARRRKFERHNEISALSNFAYAKLGLMETTQRDDDRIVFRPHEFAESKVAKKTVS